MDEVLVEQRRGLGMYVLRGARDKLLAGQRERFLREEWPIPDLPNAPRTGAFFMEKLFLFSHQHNNYFLDSYSFQTILSIRLLNQYPELDIRIINNYFYRKASAIKLISNRTEKPQLHFR